MKTISIVTPCYNEQDNVEELYRQVRDVMVGVGKYPYEHIFIDNCSLDETRSHPRRLAAADPNVKIIVNARNVGHIRSPVHGLLQARGDAVILMVADLQDPPSLIPTFIEAWELGSTWLSAPSAPAKKLRSCSSPASSITPLPNGSPASRRFRTSPALASTIAKSSSSCAPSATHTLTSAG